MTSLLTMLQPEEEWKEKQDEEELTYLVAGAQPVRVFRRLIERAMREPKD